jgi:hypothetical protein
MPKRGFWARLSDALFGRRERERADPYRKAWRDNVVDDPLRVRRPIGYQEHRDIVETWMINSRMDERESQEFWDDYSYYMVRKHRDYRYNSDDNPFWRRWNIRPEDWDWDDWREIMDNT